MVKIVSFILVLYSLNSVSLADVNDRQLKVYEAKLAKEINRYDDSVSAIVSVSKKNVLSIEEITVLKSSYTMAVEGEITNVEREVQIAIKEYLRKPADYEGKVKIFTLKGESYQYMSEVNAKAEKEYKAYAEAAFTEAYNIAKEKLSPANTARLELVVSYTSFEYNTMKNIDGATKMAYDEYRAAITEIDSSSDNEESARLIAILKKNLDLWTQGE
ncbi:14-3-3 protein eta-like [Ruditapes philippinarum]|uniref:14-3-3 protein eta-like n=1 Tax=Ruditapes philippinarum TaxID=129788 RepID=UPI00295B91A7|nr:14-3-3 protein eta-like [Ruditapes philippinarum]